MFEQIGTDLSLLRIRLSLLRFTVRPRFERQLVPGFFYVRISRDESNSIRVNQAVYPKYLIYMHQ